MAVLTVSAINELPPDEPVGERPYEMSWANRVEERIPLVDFEDLQGWKVLLFDAAKARFSRSREQQMWGSCVGKLVYRGESERSRLIIAPPEPIEIPGEFDCANIWCYGNNWGWQPDPSTPQVELTLILKNPEGEEFRVPLTKVRWKEWWLVHKKLPQEVLEKLSKPSYFAGLEVSGISNRDDRVLYFDSLSFYKEELKPLKFEPRPLRNVKPFPGQSHGLNTGPGRLPFPTREETILPDNYEEFRNSVEEISPGTFRFRYEGKDVDLAYTYAPESGDLGEISVSLNGSEWLPMKDGGVRIDRKEVEWDLISAELEDDRVRAVFSHDGIKLEYNLQIKAKSLLIDVFCLGGRATELSLGMASGVENPRLVLIPYLTFGRSNPRVLMTGGGESLAFQSEWIDWYRSNGSELFSEEWVKGDEASINGGVRYIPKTDGKRNDMFERIFLTVSPIFEETLPTIANPPSPWGQVAGEYLWQESWGPADYRKEHERSKMLRSYGIDKLIQCNHEITWRDGGESFTLRTRAAPGKGGDEALKWYVKAQKGLGWRSGLYTNYCDFAPVNEHWNEDDIQRTPEGEWRPAWPRCYALKPSRAVEYDAKLAPMIKEKFGSNAAYTDVHTAVAPWSYCDYDARVPGAGTFAATFYAYGELLWNDQRIYGPTFSEGTYQWMYAGLATGNYGLAYTNVDLSEGPLNVVFDLLKIHPLECDIGMPWTAGFFKKPGWNSPERIDDSVDRFIAATVAYGHIGWLVEEAHGIRRTCRSYYLIQGLSKRYAMKRPLKIEYADSEGRWLTPSQALETGAIEESKLHVEYPGGLHLFVNWSREKAWSFEFEGRRFELPPNGFCAFDDEGFFSGSILLDGKRVDMAVSDDYAYLDGRDNLAENDWLSAKGGVAVKFMWDRLRVIDIGGNEEIGFRCEHEDPVCLAFSPESELMGEISLERRGEKLFFRPIEGARWYEVLRR
jgi:hypothetical protein